MDNNIKIPINTSTVVSTVLFILSICVFVANFRVLSPNLSEIPKIQQKLSKQEIAISLIVNELGLTPQYKYLIAEAELDTFPTPKRTEIVEKFCKKEK